MFLHVPQAFGHSDISILDGGLSKWLAEDLPVSTDDPNSITPVNYNAIPREDLVKNMNEIIEALRKEDIQVHTYTLSKQSPGPNYKTFLCPKVQL